MPKLLSSLIVIIGIKYLIIKLSFCHISKDSSLEISYLKCKKFSVSAQTPERNYLC